MKRFYSPGEVMADRLLTVEQVAKRLQMTKMTVYRYLQAGEIAAYQIGKEYRIKESDLNEFLESKKK